MQHPRGKDVLRAEWVKAHVNVTSELNDVQAEEHYLNNVVDARAGEAAAEAGPPAAAVRFYLSALDSHVKWARSAVKLLATWPAPPKLARRVSATSDGGETSTRSASAASPHLWVWGRIDAVSGEWGFRCQECLRTCRSIESRARTPCRGIPEVVRIASHSALKHTIVAAGVGASNEVVAYCLRCGGYSSHQVRNLGAACQPKPASEQRVRSSFEKRRHPKTGKALTAWGRIAAWD